MHDLRFSSRGSTLFIVNMVFLIDPGGDGLGKGEGSGPPCGLAGPVASPCLASLCQGDTTLPGLCSNAAPPIHLSPFLP